MFLKILYLAPLVYLNCILCPLPLFPHLTKINSALLLDNKSDIGVNYNKVFFKLWRKTQYDAWKVAAHPYGRILHSLETVGIRISWLHLTKKVLHKHPNASEVSQRIQVYGKYFKRLKNTGKYPKACNKLSKVLKDY